MKLGARGQHRRRLGSPFPRLWTGMTLASAGDGLTYGAVPLLAVAINPHPLAVSTVAAADTLPWILVALPAGHLADRYDRGSVITLANAARAAAILIGAFLIATHRIGLGMLVLIVLINAAARAIYYSSFQAAIPDVVQSDNLERANAVLSGTEATAEHLVAPPVGSSLYAISASVPFLADTLALLASCLTFVRFRSKAAPAPPSESSVREGIRLLFTDRRLRVLVLMVASLAFLQGLMAGVLVLLATTEWGVRDSAYGLFLAAGAAGNIVGSVVAGAQIRRFGSARTLIGFSIFLGGGYLLMAGAGNWALAGPAYALVGIAVAVITVIVTSLRQRFTPHRLMGRVGGAWGTLVWGATPLGAIAAGGLATLGGIKTPLIIAGSLQLLVACVFARPLVRIIADDRRTRGPGPRRRHTAGRPWPDSDRAQVAE